MKIVSTYRWLITLFLFSTVAVQAQLSKPVNTPDQKEGATLVYLETCESLSFDQVRLPDAQLLRGNVRFRHDSVLMYCDSAYFYEKLNSMDAFGHIRIVQGDTLVCYGDFLYYDGNTKKARLRENVRMEDKQTILTTDSLNYDRVANLAYYFTGGTIQDSLNTLTSIWGQYSPNTHEAIFQRQVVLTNDDMNMFTDTLIYNTESYIANIVGPTQIVYQSETNIYSTRGWYNTNTENSMLLDNSLIVHKDGKSLQGDTIFYNKKIEYGEVFSGMQLTDSVQKTTLFGNYGYYNEKTEEGLATQRALLVEWSSADTLYVHADTLRTCKDSVYNTMRAYYGVRIYRADVQAVCDSVFYTDKDSIMSLYGTPIMWNQNSQISADFIQMYMKNQTIDHAHLQGAAIVVQQEDTTHYNQLSGKEIMAYIKDGELYRVDVDGNAETVFYPKEDDGSLIGVNKTMSSFVKIFFKERKVDKAVFTSATTATMYPLEQLSGSDVLLGNFFWAETERPQSKEDVFLKVPRTVRPKKTAMSASAASSEMGSRKSKDTGTEQKRGGMGGMKNK